MKNKHFFQIFTIFLLILSACAKKDPVTGEREIYETDPRKRLDANVAKGGGLFSGLGGEKNGRVVDFGTSNIMWRATLKSLEFLPLINADYNGGVIIYDWYTGEQGSNEEIKITVNFLSNELRSDSIKIIAHKRTCEQNKKCQITKANENFSNEIKNSVLASARIMKIEEEKSKKK
jgi:hypothetical protein